MTDYINNYFKKLKRKFRTPYKFCLKNIVCIFLLLACGILIIFEDFPSKQIECVKPNISNGFIDGNDYTLHGKIGFQCDEGYKLWSVIKSIEGERSYTLICTIYGTWNGTIPICKLINCVTPNPPSNGYIIGSNYNYGQRISFGCSPGYKMWTPDEAIELKEAPILFCNKNGEWTGQIPVCKVIHCETPVPPNNGYIIGSNYAYGQSITFGCSTGYKMWTADEMTEINEAPSLFCNENSEWSGQIPVCKEIKCVKPDLSNGLILGNDYTLHGKIRFQCEKGYKLWSENHSIEDENSYYLTCNSEGKWNGTIPYCKQIECVKPELSNGLILGNDLTLHGMISLECNVGYEMWSGNKSIETSYNLTCNSEGKWDSSIPTCKIINCVPPVPPSNGHIIGSTYTYGRNVTFGCSIGYKMWMADEMTELKETPILYCNENGQWTGQVPVCKAIRCQSIGQGFNAIFEYIKLAYYYGDIVRYKCIHGHILVSGDLQRKCREDGSWTGSEPMCTYKCQPPGSGQHASFIRSDRIIQYQCYPGYYLKTGDLHRTCRNDGSWTGSEPVCQSSTSSSSNIVILFPVIFCLLIILMAIIISALKCMK